jgi:uridine kinase
MKGDRIVIEDHHRRAVARIVPLLREAIAGKKTGRYVITVAGESGSGKSETAQAIVEALAPTGVKAVVLGQDDYFVLPPRSNDARRRQDPEWLGPHVEVRMDALEANLRDAIAGAEAVSKPLVDYDANAIGQETVDLAGVRVLVVEGTYVSLLRHVDTRVFIARSRRETLEHRRKRNRGSEAGDPFIEQVLAIEHKIIAGHRQLADLVITRDFDVVSADEGARLS